MVRPTCEYNKELLTVICEFRPLLTNSHLNVAVDVYYDQHRGIVEKHLNFQTIVRAILEEWKKRGHARHRLYGKVWPNHIVWRNCRRELGEQIHDAVVEELNKVLPIISAEMENSRVYPWC